MRVKRGWRSSRTRWERVEIVAKDNDNNDTPRVLEDDKDARELIEKQARKKQARLKEKERTVHGERMGEMGARRSKEILEELFERCCRRRFLLPLLLLLLDEDIRTFFQRYVVTFVTKEKYDARARTSLRRMASVLNYCNDDDDDDNTIIVIITRGIKQE